MLQGLLPSSRESCGQLFQELLHWLKPPCNDSKKLTLAQVSPDLVQSDKGTFGEAEMAMGWQREPYGITPSRFAKLQHLEPRTPQKSRKASLGENMKMNWRDEASVQAVEWEFGDWVRKEVPARATPNGSIFSAVECRDESYQRLGIRRPADRTGRMRFHRSTPSRRRATSSTASHSCRRTTISAQTTTAAPPARTPVTSRGVHM